MLFNSYIFIFLFLPLALTGYFLCNHFRQSSLAKAFLVGMSLWFYAYFEIRYLWIILASIAFNYLCHLLLIRYGGRGRTAMLAGVLGNLGILFYFKYFDFLMKNLNALFSANFSLLGLLFPLGISFFTFQQIGFLIDTARGDLKKQNLLDYALFVVFFPQLVAGPIVSSEEMLPQFADSGNKTWNSRNFYLGISLFATGLFKKVILADSIGKAVDWGYTYHTVLYGINSVIIIILYSMQLYLDFSGYCDMARGIGKMFNIELPVNFLSPFKAVDILDFWKRWHITLTRFFTKYVYIPLGGNRKGRFRTYLNVLIVFALSGLWHGANWTFVLWGVLHGVLSVLTRMYRQYVKKPICSVIARLLTFLFVAFAFAIFRADSIAQSLEIFKSIADFRDCRVFLEIALAFEMPELKGLLAVLHLTGRSYTAYLYMIIICGMASVVIWGMPNAKELEEKYADRLLSSGAAFLWTLILAGISVWSIISLAGVSSFLYFNF